MEKLEEYLRAILSIVKNKGVEITDKIILKEFEKIEKEK